MPTVTIDHKVYTNEDDVLIVWKPSAPIPGCRGFAIERTITRKGANQSEQSFLLNRVGFQNSEIPNTPPTGKQEVTRASNQWPFQRFSWTDHDANTGDLVSYRVVALIREGDKSPLEQGAATKWSNPVVLGGDPNAQPPAYQAFFNRGFVMSQFMSRYLDKHGLSVSDFKKQINDEDENAIKEFLSGDLKRSIATQLEIAKKEKGEVYAALFELNDSELIAGIAALKQRAHVVLANGAVKSVDEDENDGARRILEKSGVNISSRAIAPKGLGHNKFLVRVDSAGNPVVALTGSTNWTKTGMATQLNNVLIASDPAVAKEYLDQWHRLATAGDNYSDRSLVEANSTPKQVGGTTIWFTRTSKSVDLTALRDVIAEAKQGIVFQMFMPGASADGAYRAVVDASKKPGLYVRGVVSQLPSMADGDESEVDVEVVSSGTRAAVKSMTLKIVQPTGARHALARWALDEVSRREFGQIGHAIVHSKVLVIDPFTDSPIVVTGSHNFSGAASKKNDENFIIIRGDRSIAEQYAVNALMTYQHYKWRSYVNKAGARPFNYLSDDDKWQAAQIRSSKADWDFFGL